METIERPTRTKPRRRKNTPSVPTSPVSTAPLYVREGAAGYRPLADTEVLEAAADILQAMMRRGPVLTSASLVGRFLQCQIGLRPAEVFTVLYLDAQNRLLDFREVFYGTLDTTAVYPREVARQALEIGAAHVIVAHNHPSGSGTPSDADIAVTNRLREALAVLDIKLLDHFIVTCDSVVSLKSRGLF